MITPLRLSTFKYEVKSNAWVGFFGEMAVMENDRVCHRTIRCQTPCTLRYLESHAIDNIASIASIRSKLELYAKTRLKADHRRLGINKDPSTGKAMARRGAQTERTKRELFVAAECHKVAGPGPLGALMRP